MSRFALLVTLVLGCGRIGFDAGNSPPVDAPTDGPAVTCDPFTQTGCPMTLACYFDQLANPVCLPPGTAMASERCSSNGDCTPGSSCVALRPGSGTCTEFCRDAAECGFGRCLDVSLPGVGACELECDPITHAGCVDRCFLVVGNSFPPASTGAATYCGPEGGAAIDQPCVNAADCGSGLTCAQNLCRPLCDVDTPTCAPPLVCAPFDPAVIRLGTTFGVCVDPAGG